MMRLAARFAKLIGYLKRDDHRLRTRTREDRPRRFGWEPLETRQMLSGTGLGTDYTLMGGQWDNSKTITVSIAPDGVNWDQGTNDINAKLDAEFGGTSWQGLIVKALQTWSAATNLNFTLVADGPYNFSTPRGSARAIRSSATSGLAATTSAQIPRSPGPTALRQTDRRGRATSS